MKQYLVIFLILVSNTVFSQTGDTIRTETQKRDTTTKPVTPFDTNKIPNAYRMSDNSVTYGQSNWIWNDRRNLGEILNERPGFLVNFLGDGGRNPINFNNFRINIGMFLDGIQVNDNFHGGFDIENISINEIDSIEELSNISSFLYGINTQTKAVNIITKNVFQPELFSQLRFTQDRYGSENADVYFSQSISRKINWQLGATKHSLSGRYQNSDFDVWRARFRTNWFISPKANIRFNLNYANIQRGLNEGLIYSSEDTLTNPELAKVQNPDSYEKYTNFYYDISITGRFFKDKNSLTKIKLYSQNSLREYRDEENRPNSNSRFISKNFHTIQYGADVKQNIAFNINKEVFGDLLIGGNIYLNLFDFDLPFVTGVNKYNVNYYSGLAKFTGKYNNFNVVAATRYDVMFDEAIFQYGFEANYLLYQDKHFSINTFGGISFRRNGLIYFELPFYNYDSTSDPVNGYGYEYSEVGFNLKYKNLFAKLYHYNYSDENLSIFENGNYEIGLLSENIDILTSLNLNIGNRYFNQPELFLKSDISYHDFFFENNLNLKIGINLKYLRNLKAWGYSEEFYYTVYPYNDSIIDHLFNMDAYIGARIGSANIAFVFANIFDNFNYDTFLYPWNDRGGALNALSRFTITWDFFN